MVPAGAARRGRPHRPSPAARGAAAARAPWRGPGSGGRGPGAVGGSSAAPSRALGAGSAAQRSGGGGRRSRAGGRPVVAAAGGGDGGDGGDGGGPGPGWRAGGSCDPDTRSPPGRGAGAGAGWGRGGEAAGGARPLYTHPTSCRSRGKGTHRPGGRAPGLPPPEPGGRGPGRGLWACTSEPDKSSENHFIARVLGSGVSQKGAHRRPHPRCALQGEPLRGWGRGARSRGLEEARVVAAAAAPAVAPPGAWLSWPCRGEYLVVRLGSWRVVPGQ